MEIENQIKNKVQEFFNWINFSYIKNYYIKDLQNWDAICASLHLLNDLQRPKSEYYVLETINYLETIGVMQTLYIEQDCIQTLRNSLLENNYREFNLNNYNKVRETRNKVFGHPSDKKTGSIKTRHFFDIVDKNKQLIKHTYWGTSKKCEREFFKIDNLVLENSKTTLAYMQEIEQEIKYKFNKIMEKYTIKFNEIFDNAVYTFEKLLTKENDYLVIDSFDENIIFEVDKVKKGLIERNVFQEFEKEIQVIEFFIEKLITLFYNQTYKDIEFYSYASTLNDNISLLKENLIKIDTAGFFMFNDIHDIM